MKLKTLVEELRKAFEDPHGNYIEIFVNPTRGELESALKLTGSIRWAAKNKKLYIFPSSTIHHAFLVRIGMDPNEQLDGTWLTGALEGQNRFSSDAIAYFLGSLHDKEKVKKIEKLMKRNWNWIDEYLPPFTKWWNKRKKSIRVRIDSFTPIKY